MPLHKIYPGPTKESFDTCNACGATILPGSGTLRGRIRYCDTECAETVRASEEIKWGLDGKVCDSLIRQTRRESGKQLRYFHKHFKGYWSDEHHQGYDIKPRDGVFDVTRRVNGQVIEVATGVTHFILAVKAAKEHFKIDGKK